MAARIVALDDLAGLDELRPLWIGLHRHHRHVSPFDVFVADDQLSWARRRSLYEGYMRAGGIVLVARVGREAVGYAVAHLIDGPNDSFATSDRYAEIATLYVAAHVRGAGLGGRLMDAMDERLARLGIVDLIVSVIDGNDDGPAVLPTPRVAAGRAVPLAAARDDAAHGAGRAHNEGEPLTEAHVSPQIACLWKSTKLMRWPGTYVVVDLPVGKAADAGALFADAEAFCTVLAERDQISLTIDAERWRSCDLVDEARDVGGPFRIVTLDQDVGLDVSGFLAGPIQRLAEAGIAIIPHGSYLKEHWAFLEDDFDRAVSVIADYIEDVTGQAATITDADPRSW